MQSYQQQFIQFAIDAGVLRFGEFTLKSGRISPYFFNSGLFNSGLSLAQLGNFYAQALNDSKIDFNALFGPAYKGIPLASSCAIAMANQFHRDIPYAFNRKEIKDHGEGGQLVGAELKGRIIIIDDVISAGTSVRESFEIIEQAGAEVAGVLIALNRQEKGQGEVSAITEIEQTYKIPVISIIKLQDLIDYLENLKGNAELQEYAGKIQEYRRKYGENL